MNQITMLTSSSLPSTNTATPQEALQTYQCMQSQVGLGPEELAQLVEFVPIREFPKGTMLLRAGAIPTACYYNFKGLVREFYLKDGEERTTQFYLEGEGISACLSGAERVPSPYYLECVEACTLSVLTAEREVELYRRFPRLESICRVQTERLLLEYKAQMTRYITSSPEERYLHLKQQRPELLTRVPQYQLASYIGVKPESLSRIRRRLLERGVDATSPGFSDI